MRLLSTVCNDIKIQFRSGFYGAYLFICILYILIVRQIPINYRAMGVFYVIFTDPSVLGFYFVGGLLLLERRQRTLSSLFITPLRLREYIISKILSLSVLSLISSLLITFSLMGFKFNIVVLSLTVVLTSALFTLIGITLGARAKSINHYLFISPLYLLVTILPVFSFLGLVNQYLFVFIPTHSILNLLHFSIIGDKTGNLIFDLGMLILWIGITYFWAKNWFVKYIVNRTGN